MQQTDATHYASRTTDQLKKDLKCEAELARCARLLGSQQAASEAQQKVDLILDELNYRGAF